MKTCLVAFAVVSLCFELLGTPFQNLNFDSADTSNLFDLGGALGGYVTNLVPGWVLSLSGQPPHSVIPYNNFPGGPGFSTIADSSNPLNYPIAGSYTLVLSGFGFSQPSYIPYILTQSGDIPLDAMSIRFTTFGAPYELSANGVSIALHYDYLPGNTDPLKRQASAMGDISSFAGQSVQLQFSTALGADGGFINGLDEISFSTIPVPEPGTWLLLSLGSVAIVFQRRRQ